MRDPFTLTMPPTAAVPHLLEPVIALGRSASRLGPWRPTAVGDEFVDVTAGDFYERVRGSPRA